jgi:hypothetical protein
MAAALLVLGFMIWGVHKDVDGFRREAGTVGTTLLDRINGATSQLSTTNDKLDQAHLKLDAASSKLDRLKPTGHIRVGRPRVRAVAHLPPHPPTVMEQLFGASPGGPPTTAPLPRRIVRSPPPHLTASQQELLRQYIAGQH